ncbi:uncharacterized protein LOC108477357 [Gossypium arboreum]|uniref:uncharacterized protein LOC108477357 n=1 Tax=Gossypium arboreum TaxID=29729 RepID=UPI0022F16884|nr:uncharacterized protein LOC108477357 [Gossypium arboreum]
MDAKELSLVSDLVLPPKFKILEFEKYNETSFPEAHITMFCRRMTGHVNNDQLLIHCFQDNIAPDRITLQNIEKKSNESFRQYTQRWREAPFINHILGSATKSLADIVMSGEMIENAIRCGKIEAGESIRRSAPKKRENEVSNVSMGYTKPITVNQPKAVATGQQASSRQEPNTKQNMEKPQFTPIPITYRELYKSMFDAHVVSPFYLRPLQPPFPKWYNTSAQCEYHAGIMEHSIENCTYFKKVVERLIKMGVVKFDDALDIGNPLPNHIDHEVNVIVENMERRIKLDMAEVKTPMREVLKKMVERSLIMRDFGSKSREVRNYCKFHGEEDHEIETCNEFRALVQGLMDNKELEFFEFAEEEDVSTSEEGLIERVCEVSHPVLIISRPRINEFGARIGPRVLIQKLVTFPYNDRKMGEEGTKPLVNEPVTEDEAKKILKFLKHSEYSVVEQLHTQPTRTSVLALLQSLMVQRNALMNVLNETYVAEDISVNKLDRLVSNISADNFISFSDDEIPPEGLGSTKALHITTRYKGYTFPRVLIDNGLTLNVLPLSILNRLPIDSSHMKICQNIMRAFDGTERKVMGRIEVPLLIRPNTYEVDFLVMDITPSYNYLLERPWIHSAKAIPSSLHQKLKLVTEGWLITINAEEDIIASATSNALYIEYNDEAVECSFRSLEFVNATFIIEGKRIPRAKISEATRMGLQLTVGKGALPGRGLGKYLHGRVEVPILADKQDHFGLGYRPDAKQKIREMEMRQERRRA